MNLYVFYHHDIDGHAAGNLLVNYARNNNLLNKDNFFEVNYTDPLPIEKITKEDEVWFVDYSFTEQTSHYLFELLEIGCDLTWIDHHKSSIEMIEKHPELKNIKGIRDNNACGALLTYLYLNNYTLEDIDTDKIPMYLKYVDDYDRWVFKYGDSTTHFKLGVESGDWGVFSDRWEYINDSVFLANTILIGKVIKNYIDNDNAIYLKNYGYESEINGLKCLVVNKKTNSWIFGDKIKEYPVCMVYCYNGEKFTYSIFSQDPNVDCAKIAESFGGGGHKGAAGFSSSVLLFDRK